MADKQNDEGKIFRFRQFEVRHDVCGMKIGTDAVLLGALCASESIDFVPDSILDIGTGSGVVALMLAQRFPEAKKIIGIEIEPEAACLANENFKNSPWKDKLNAVNEDVKEFAKKAQEKYDLIVSNPPYFRETGQSHDAKRRMARSEETLTLRDLASAVSSHLADNGSASVILPVNREEEAIFEFAFAGLELTGECEIRSFVNGKAIRKIYEFSRKPQKFNSSILCIRNSDNSYSQEYITATEPFYTHLK